MQLPDIGIYWLDYDLEDGRCTKMEGKLEIKSSSLQNTELANCLQQKLHKTCLSVITSGDSHLKADFAEKMSEKFLGYEHQSSRVWLLKVQIWPYFSGESPAIISASGKTRQSYYETLYGYRRIQLAMI